MIKRLLQFFALATVVAFMQFLVSCDKNEMPQKEQEVLIEEVTGSDGEKYTKISSILELPENWPLKYDQDSIQMHMEHLDTCVNVVLWFAYRNVEGILHYSLYIPQESIWNDGRYKIMDLLDSNGDSNFQRLLITVENGIIMAIEEENNPYSSLKGNGTLENPYVMPAVEGVVKFAASLKKDANYHGKGKYFKLTADIDMNSYYMDPNRVMDQGWCGIGDGFAGNFDGANHMIYNLRYSSADSSNIGLFKRLLDGACLKRLNIQMVNITSAKNNVGSVAGVSNGKVILDSIYVSGNIKVNGEYAGGLVGKVEGDTLVIKRSRMLVGTLMGLRYCGGLVGGIAGSGLVKISDSYNDAFNVEGTSTDIGGFIGFIGSTRDGNLIEGCTSNATVYGSMSVGGMIGQSKGVKLTDIYVQANKIISELGYCGGIAGYNVGKMEVVNSQVFHSSSANYKEDVIGSGNISSVGGFVGHALAGSDVTIVDCLMKAPVKGKDYVGGFVGYAGGSVAIKGSSNSNSSQLHGETRVGGYVGCSTSNSFTVSDDCEQYCDVYASNGFAGGIVGETGKASIESVYLNAQVTADGFYVGGIAGYATGISLKSIEYGSNVAVNGPNDVGGIAGRLLSSTIGSNLLAEGTKYTLKVCGNDAYIASAVSVGGIAGSADKCKFTDIKVDCSVYGSRNVGGITGYDVNGTYKGCEFSGKEVEAVTSDAGGIVGRGADGTITLDSLKNSGKVKSPLHTGGIVGELMNNGISNCVNNGYVEGGQDTGGIVGRLDNNDGSANVEISTCSNDSTVTASKRCLGGIVGYVETDTNGDKKLVILKCFNNGTVEGTMASGGDEHGMGGLVGEGAYSIHIKNSGNKGIVKGTAAYSNIGGLVGYFGKNSLGYDNDIFIEQCYNAGPVFVTQSDANSTFIGGIAGHLQDSNTSYWDVHIKNCYNRGEITSTSTASVYRAGGIVGKASYYLAMEYCYSSGKVLGKKETIGPGMAGCHQGGETLFPDSRLNKLFIEDGTGLDHWNEDLPVFVDWGSYFDYADRSNTSTYGGFDFSENGIWKIDTSLNGGYPYLTNTPL